ncbi:2-C-methyl-D-erythritol 4-phosphate cytidylyltransferase [Kineothrix alysoides]|uniref:2-C-methyl-D-erythritol 4-phosphate cytidylyltransferase n=1 Tax=Kineothrix alysoides TaxID=1469948 RepID=A0A4R1QYS4_9FIRM|nr:IspD/TarI family cytidylyltransferase [Kineothrix alysoides]TCL58113.1 2-C-methyl-D-erythritol 4-phosphate cytidylyltransferase [Kineothrix alysoides]
MNIALILAGGTGTRIGGEIPKQYVEIAGKPVICYCLKTFALHPRVDAIQIVADISWHAYLKQWIEDEAVLEKWKGFSRPGKNRQFSILNALEDACQYASEEDWVIVHDAARPFLTNDFITESLIKANGHDGVLPVLPMKDTVYFSQNGSSVSSLLNRNNIFAGQAPEVFKFGKYYEANKSLVPDEILKINGSTEPAILAGMDIVMIDGDEENFKITTKKDLERFRQKIEGMK